MEILIQLRKLYRFNDVLPRKKSRFYGKGNESESTGDTSDKIKTFAEIIVNNFIHMFSLWSTYETQARNATATCHRNLPLSTFPYDDKYDSYEVTAWMVNLFPLCKWQLWVTGSWALSAGCCGLGVSVYYHYLILIPSAQHVFLFHISLLVIIWVVSPFLDEILFTWRKIVYHSY